MKIEIVHPNQVQLCLMFRILFPIQSSPKLRMKTWKLEELAKERS